MAGDLLEERSKSIAETHRLEERKVKALEDIAASTSVMATHLAQIQSLLLSILRGGTTGRR